MWKALKWFFIGWALLLILSDLQITTSLYKYEDNRVVVNFPRWQADQPWGTFELHAGRVLFRSNSLINRKMGQETALL